LEPLVSVICVTQNHERFCIESLDSVLNQTYKNIEWIILDAVSIDSTVELIDKWLVENNVNAVFLKEKDLKPITVNLNKALTYAHGEYVQFLSLDDILYPSKIEIQLEEILNLKCDIICSKAETIDINGNFIKIYQEDKNLNQIFDLGLFRENILKSCFILLQSCLISFRQFEIVGFFDENLEIEDWDWLIRFSKSNGKIRNIDKTLVKYRTIEGSLWYNRNYSLFKSHFSIIIKHSIRNKSVLKTNIEIFINQRKMTFQDKLKIIKFLLVNLKSISVCIYFISRDDKLFNTIWKLESCFNSLRN